MAIRLYFLLVLIFFTSQSLGVTLPQIGTCNYDVTECFITDRNIESEVQIQHYDDTSILRYCCNNLYEHEKARMGSFFAAVSFSNATKRTTQSGIGVSRHSVNQKINRGVRSADELDALKNPLDIRPVKIDQFGRPSQRHIGRKAEVAVNPETGKVVGCRIIIFKS